MQSSPTEYYSAQPSPWLATVSISIVLHLLLFALISHYGGSKVKSTKLPNPVIVATLMYPANITKQASETTVETIEEIKDSLASVKDVETGLSEPLKPLVEEALTAEPDTVVASKELALQTEVPALSKIISTPEPKDMASISANYSLLGSGSSYMQSLEEAKKQQLAAQASRAYQKARISPEIKAPEVDPFISEDEKLIKASVIKTDCSSSLNLTLRLVAGFAGGLIQCSELPEIDSFIQARLQQHTRPASLPTK